MSFSLLMYKMYKTLNKRGNNKIPTFDPTSQSKNETLGSDFGGLTYGNTTVPLPLPLEQYTEALEFQVFLWR